MGLLDDPRQVTFYASFTNLLASGSIVLEGREHRVRGKAWFDKQGGPYSLTNPRTNWEWFSFRFFDEEELMLFVFPQGGHQDGTWIHRDGSYERLNRRPVQRVHLRELLADIIDRRGERVGYCFVELLPGARNKKLNSLLAFKRKR
jgi:predicted secreted hydrolase